MRYEAIDASKLSIDFHAKIGKCLSVYLDHIFQLDALGGYAIECITKTLYLSFVRKKARNQSLYLVQEFAEM